MSPRNRWFGRTPIVRAARALALLALLALLPAAARGDDRSLLRTSSADPYLFILLDTSGSMNWSPKSDTCSTGDCYVPLQSDDSASKLYQAKQALYEVLSDPNLGKVNLGFGTYNQDALSSLQKHWLYQAAGNGVLLSGTTYYPPNGAQEVFGNLWGCDTGNNDNEIGCYSTKPADLDDTWEVTRVQRLPKGGLTFASPAGNQTFYIRNAGVVYRVTYQPNGGSYGGNINVKVTVVKCTNSSCSTTSAVGTAVVNYTLVSDFISWDNADTNNPSRTNPQLSYFTSVAVDTDVANTCNGWDPNTDTTSDKNSGGYSLRWPTDTSDPRAGGQTSSPFSIGDILPLDWKTDHKVDILKRLAPNYTDGSTTPDFRVATYLKDSRSGSETFLRLKDENQRPIIATGSTPLGASVKNFRTWYSGCSNDTCGSLSGWAKVASSGDNSFECRQKFLLIVTDGDETCSGDPCKYTKLLKDQYGVITYVVAFGVTATPGNTLSCMADAQHLFYPQTKDELVKDLKSVLGKINEQASTFASAAVPSVQANVADHIYLSSFTPLNDEGYWDGHLDAYLKPLPLTSDGKPDRSTVCSSPGGSTRSSCWLWDAGAVLKTQAPAPSDLVTNVNSTTLRLGASDTQRRVFYTKAVTTSGAVPSTLRLLTPPSGDPKSNPTPDWTDLLNGFKIPLPVTATDSTNTVKRVNNIMATSLEIKSATVSVTGQPDVDITYVLGDIFHADPVLADRPNNFSYFSGNLYATSGATDCTGNPGYQCFVNQQLHRRKMLLAGANDGQLHVFDAGIWDDTSSTFTDGTGKEIFSYMPRLVMPVVRDQAENSHQIFGVDGTPKTADVFIDPVHNGTPTAADREWRTVVIGGFREGGSVDGGSRLSDFVSGYYALDITHPDKLDASNNPTTGTVPSCLDLSNNTVSGCGTLPFPAVLWEYTDSIGTSQLDEDKNGYADLGQTWSVPTIGRIKVIEGGKQVDKFVAIFAGGMDADNKTSPKRGNWLYMVDVETGQTLYKRALVGAAPADPAVLDKNQDGYLDTIYIGTIAGYMYKVDISSPVAIQSVTLTTSQAVPALAAATTVNRIVDTAWDPFPIFDTGGRPIYLAATPFYVAQLSRYALAFGTGDRENLWNLDSQVGRFYLIVDDNFAATTAGLPMTEANYQALDASSADVSSSTDFVSNPPAGKSKGWFITLTSNERVITQTFGLAGIIIFSSYQPQDTAADGVCALGGTSHLFVVFATNGNSVSTVGGTETRFRVVPNFVTNPYTESGTTKNPPSSGGGSNGGGNSKTGSGCDDATQQEIVAAVKKLYPRGCKFGNYSVKVNGLLQTTGQVCYATVPLCIVEANWREN